MSGKKQKNEISISERGSFVDAGIYCEDGNCQILLGPIDDLVLRHTATFNVEKHEVEKLLEDIIVVTAKMLVKYLEAKQ
uniref:Uncharacterized protein n=1 Tax=archaeon enrichment culture clone 1(2010) TaxID=795325 RepID=D9CGE4_9ARCH|nr:hypothetical protein pHA1_gp20 [archaeon enrichment culture clone 1(2010)]